MKEKSSKFLLTRQALKNINKKKTFSTRAGIVILFLSEDFRTRRDANTNMNLSISTSTISRILRQYNMVSHIKHRGSQELHQSNGELELIAVTNICLGLFKLAQR